MLVKFYEMKEWAFLGPPGMAGFVPGRSTRLWRRRRQDPGVGHFSLAQLITASLSQALSQVPSFRGAAPCRLVDNPVETSRPNVNTVLGHNC